MPDVPAYAHVSFPSEGGWRLHRAPTQLRPREGDAAIDRFDDPENEYRVRYLASTQRGALLEVLDHLRGNDQAEVMLAKIEHIEGLDLLEEEEPGTVTDAWLARKRWALAELAATARFVDVNDPANLAELNDDPGVQAALRTSLARETLGDNARLDEGTIRMVGPVGRAITQAVSRVVYNHPANFVGIAYRTRFDDTEQCWAVFDDRVHVQFSAEEPLDNTNPDHRRLLAAVAKLYHLHLAPNWRDS